MKKVFLILIIAVLAFSMSPQKVIEGKPKKVTIVRVHDEYGQIILVHEI